MVSKYKKTMTDDETKSNQTPSPPNQGHQPNLVRKVTNGRRIARFLKRYKLYFPSQYRLDEHDKMTSIKLPSLEKAWDVFEYECLPRCLVDIEDTGKGRKYSRAEIGEKQPTKLYPVYDTPLADMADFGIGVGMYFQTVKYFGVVTFLAGCISIPIMIFYQSESYSFGGKQSLNFVERWSAVCTDTQFQPCPSCLREDWSSFPRDLGRLLFAQNDEMKFILVNQCNLNDAFGFFSIATLLFVICAVYLFVYLQRLYRLYLDEGVQTPSDYSVQIKHAPKSTSTGNPETWKTFFEERFENLHVTVCTVAVKNEMLIKLLIRKHRLLTNIADLLPLDITFDENKLDEMAQKCRSVSFWDKLFYCGKPAEKVLSKVKQVDSQINKLLEEPHFEPTNIFITFETEEMQADVLEAMKKPDHLIDDSVKFEGELLHVTKPDEPSSIRWHSLNSTLSSRILQKTVTYTLSCFLISGAAVLIEMAYESSTLLYTVTIILFNTISPFLVRLLTKIESHESETTFAVSTYIKVTVIRWVLTAVVTTMITPFSDTLESGKLINSLHVLFAAELLQRPLIQLVGWMGHLQRHVFGVRAPNQRRMNLWFMSSPYSIGERYTEVTKVLFLTFFYSSIFPIGFFFASAILFVYYWVDKYSFLRTWRQGPMINADISMLSTYFLWLTILAYALVTAYTYSSFPLDNACITNESVPDVYIGNTFVVSSGEHAGTNFTITLSDQVYEYCDQNLFRQGLSKFPPLPMLNDAGSAWMNTSQKMFSNLYGIVLIGVICLVIISISVRLFIRFVRPLLVDSYTAKGKLSSEAFSDVYEIDGYVPQLKLGGFQYPILVCDVSNIDHNLIGWNEDFNSHTLLNYVPESKRNKCFSVVKQWHPVGICETPTSKLSKTSRLHGKNQHVINSKVGSVGREVFVQMIPRP